MKELTLYDDYEQAFENPYDTPNKTIARRCPFKDNGEFCGEWCPHFNIVQDRIQITCSGSTVTIGTRKLYNKEAKDHE